MQDFEKIIKDPAQKQLWEASAKGDCGQIRLAILNGADIDARDETGRTALNIASQNGQTDAMKTLTAAKHMMYFAEEEGTPEQTFIHRARARRKSA
ncbi:MAG: ankyrin repeat domain-containing protein [Pseudomonadota bacterium]